MLSIGSLGSTGLNSSLDASQKALTAAIQQLSTARAINSAADNPAGLAQSTSYNVQVSSLAQAMNGMQDSVSLTDTALGGLGSVADSLQQLNSLAVQAGNGALSASDKAALQQQADQVIQGLDQTVSGTQFNGQSLLDGSFSQSLISGGNGQTTAAAIGSVSSASLGLSGFDITSAAGQSNAITAVANALQQVSAQQSSLGALQSGLQADIANAGTNVVSLSAANSRIADTDYGKTSSDLAQSSVKQQAALKAVSAYNAMQKSTLSLLP